MSLAVPCMVKIAGILRAGQSMIHVAITGNSHSDYSISNLGSSFVVVEERRVGVLVLANDTGYLLLSIRCQ